MWRLHPDAETTKMSKTITKKQPKNLLNLNSGKEEQKALNSTLPLIDYGARMYDPTIARWMSVDPMAEKYYHISPYGYCKGNPILLVDPDGSLSGPFNPPYPSGLYYLALIKNADNHYIKQSSYAIAHPFRAIKVGISNNTISWGMSGYASNFEVNLRNEAGFTSGKGSEGNAFRHVLWQAMITREYGEDYAKEIGYAHEDALPVDMSQRSFDSLEKADQMADLLNNEIGRDIGLINSEASNKSVSEAILKEFKENGLWMVTEDNNRFKVERRTIPQKQLDKAIEVINKKGENGLNVKVK